jgi:hypothetical protein
MSIARPAQQSSVQERVLQRVADLLVAAGTDAGSFIHRGRVDPHSIDELPAANIRRSTGLNDAFHSGVDRGLLEFEIDHLVEGDDWETAADALHCQCHAAIAQDETLASFCKGLRCIRTEPRAQAGDKVRGTLTATYQVQALHAVADLSVKP